MTPPRRLTLEAPDGRVVVRDLSRPGARLVEIELPDGRTVQIAEHLAGWVSGDGPGVLFATVADAVRALTGRTRDGEDWISVLEEFATGLGAPAGAPLPADQDARLRELQRRAPGTYADGPRAHHSGGWYMFIGGLPDGSWVMEYGDAPAAAARAALDHADALLGPDPGGPPG
jgi:hypothetical protein